MTASDDKVDFGYEQVSPAEKTRRVSSIFRAVATRYDVMNDVMSLGTHRLLKRMTVQLSGVRPGHAVLDLAGGTGDFAHLYAPLVGAEGRVVLADLSAAMMAVGRERLLNSGHANVAYCRTDAEALPFADGSFDCLTIGFGLRNVTRKEAALHEMRRVLKPHGVALVLEFSKPAHAALDGAYQGFQSLWPAVGRLVTGSAEPYRYLIESIRMHPNQAALTMMMQDAGFADVSYHNLLGGIAAIHRGRAA